MNINDVLEKIKSIHATPVPCKISPNESNIEFDGDFEDFLAFLEAHCHKTVMVQRHSFQERNFQIKNEAFGKEDEDLLDARTIARRIRRFERYLNTDIGFSCIAWMKETNSLIGYIELDPWYYEFDEEREAAEKAAKDLIERLNALENDPAFCALRSPRAMYAYATETIEGLSELREGKVKQAIALMADKIGTRNHIKVR
jgi:hypothetical protein